VNSSQPDVCWGIARTWLDVDPFEPSKPCERKGARAQVFSRSAIHKNGVPLRKLFRWQAAHSLYGKTNPRVGQLNLIGTSALVLATVAFMVSFSPVASAQTVDLTLAAYSCTVDNPGYCGYACPSQCSNVINVNDNGYACLKWTNDPSLSVSVTSHQKGAPSPLYDPNPTCPVGSRDWTFDFKVTYIAPTCVVGSYNVQFTAYKMNNPSDYVTKTFTMYTHCLFAP
jgi:hypothetical protein